MLENSVELSNAAKGLFIKTDRFKTTLISYNFYLPLDKDRVAEFALLPFILTTCGREYPDFCKLNYKLNKLYSASLSASAEKVGDYQLLKIGISVLDDKYALDGEQLVSKAAELLNSLIFDPRVENGAFYDSDVEREKRKAIEHIRGEIAEKRLYAKKRTIEEMFKDDIYGVSKCGTEKQVLAITGASLYSAWCDMLKRANLVVNVISNTLPQNIFEDVKSRLALIDRTAAISILPSKPIKPVFATRRVLENLDVAQGKLVMGFSAEIGTDLNCAAVFDVMCNLFGGAPHSRLFTNVREKMGLCYYCLSTGNRLKGYMLVESGVEAENAKKAEFEIIRQLEVIKNGQFSDFEFESSKLSIINALNSYGDSQDTIDGWYTVRCALTEPVSPEEYAEIISKVSDTDVKVIAKDIRLHTVYTLMPKGAQ